MDLVYLLWRSAVSICKASFACQWVLDDAAITSGKSRVCHAEVLCVKWYENPSGCFVAGGITGFVEACFGAPLSTKWVGVLQPNSMLEVLDSNGSTDALVELVVCSALPFHGVAFAVAEHPVDTGM
ncbi:hypothetical protein Nepgr_033837 [Nepenthes gracilis]|uniref:Uncharacterized protein n=1 Tax=Nepenthes gracilis TaxID=150966 RepID=A0AAD3Y785_NEPGR|nr:hypothetical protein Nepgr_033837 [Nepenthes gracilis]